MKVIESGVESVVKSWGTQKVKSADYRLLKYSLSVKTADGVLLLNTVTGELVLLNSDEEVLLENRAVKYSTVLDELIAHYFAVPIDFDEKSAVYQLRKIHNLFYKKEDVNSYTILPTTGCNARCFYCYEAGYKHIFMTEAVADQTVKFIADHCGVKKQVGIGWFGGEPTLGIPIIDRICNGLKESGIEYSSSMISNGYLFDEDTVKKAKDLWKLTNIQVTLDGTEDVYNKVKSYVNVTGSPYKRVLNNIKLLLNQEIRVSVRMNLDRHNYEDLHTLIEELANLFEGNKFFSAYVHPLFDDCGFEPVRHDLEENVWLIEKQTELNLFIRDKKMFREREREMYLPHLFPHCCMADSDRSLIINPYGNFAKCEHFCEENFGNVFDGITDSEGIEKWKDFILHDNCEDCPLFPKCINLTRCLASKVCYKETVAADIESVKKTMLHSFEKTNVK